MSNIRGNKELYAIMRPAMAAAVMALIGGEHLRLESANWSSGERVLMADMVRDVPEGMVGFGSSIIRIMANGFTRTVYAKYVDERCRELFGFGLTLEGDHVVLKGRESKHASAAMGYSYHVDEQGREMINGDYARVLDDAYLTLFSNPESIISPTDGHAFIYFRTAKIYLSDLEVTAMWCGDHMVIADGKVHLEATKGEK